MHTLAHARLPLIMTVMVVMVVMMVMVMMMMEVVVSVVIHSVAVSIIVIVIVLLIPKQRVLRIACHARENTPVRKKRRQTGGGEGRGGR